MMLKLLDKIFQAICMQILIKISLEWLMALNIIKNLLTCAIKSNMAQNYMKLFTIFMCRNTIHYD